MRFEGTQVQNAIYLAGAEWPIAPAEWEARAESALDPKAFDLSATLVACLAATGATDAAQAHYRSLASAHERELGLPAHSYEQMLTRVPKQI